MNLATGSSSGGSKVALLAEGVDRNTTQRFQNYGILASPSSRRAWIEISPFFIQLVVHLVALLAEGVDRNSSATLYISCAL